MAIDGTFQRKSVLEEVPGEGAIPNSGVAF